MHAALVLAALFASAEATAPPGTVTFQHAAPTVGTVDQLSDTLEIGMTMNGSVEGATVVSFTMKSTTTKKYTETIVAWGESDRAVDIHWTEAREVETGDTPEGPIDQTTAAVTEGKSYRATWTEGATVVFTNPDGSTPPAEETAWLAEEYEAPGTDSKFSDMVGDAPVAIGADLGSDKQLLEAVFDMDAAQGEMAIRTLKLDRVEVVDGERCAVILGTFDLTKPQAGANMTATMEIEGFVRLKDSVAVGLTMKGPMTLQGSKEVQPGVVIVLDGSGTVAGTKVRSKAAAGKAAE